jgi:hypothetical protein
MKTPTLGIGHDPACYSDFDDDGLLRYQQRAFAGPLPLAGCEYRWRRPRFSPKTTRRTRTAGQDREVGTPSSVGEAPTSLILRLPPGAGSPSKSAAGAWRPSWFVISGPAI